MSRRSPSTGGPGRAWTWLVACLLVLVSGCQPAAPSPPVAPGVRLPPDWRLEGATGEKVRGGSKTKGCRWSSDVIVVNSGGGPSDIGVSLRGESEEVCSVRHLQLRLDVPGLAPVIRELPDLRLIHRSEVGLGLPLTVDRAADLREGRRHGVLRLTASTNDEPVQEFVWKLSLPESRSTR